MQQNPQKENNCALQGHFHKDPAQEIHLKRTHIRIDSKAACQVKLDLIVGKL